MIKLVKQYYKFQLIVVAKENICYNNDTYLIPDMLMIHLEPHNPQWIALYNIEKANLKKSMYAFDMHIEHIGSTAIQGIIAKPIIDIMIGVPNLLMADIFLVNIIEKLQYLYLASLETYIPQRMFFQKFNFAGLRTHHIHLVPLNSEFWVRHIQFRDYLNLHPTIAKDYEELKVNLAYKFDNTNLYANAKTDFIRRINKQAAHYFKK